MVGSTFKLTRHPLAVCCAILMAGCCGGQNFAENVDEVNMFFSKELHQDIDKVAVMPFKGPTELIGSSVSDLFMTELMRMDCYTLVERSQMAKVLGEAELALAGLSDAQAVRVGSMAGADGTIIGTVTEYEQIAYKGKMYPSVGVTLRLIDNASGQVVWSADYAERTREKGVSMSEHARNVVHHISSAIYRKGTKKLH